MHVAALREFLAAQIARAKADDVLFSVHLKATMMKVSDPIIFGHVVRAFFPALFDEFGDVLAAADISPNDGLGTLLAAAATLPEGDADQGRRRRRARRRPARWRWSTPTAASPTCTCRPTSSSTPRCRR